MTGSQVTMRVWRGDAGGGAFRDYHVASEEGMVVLDVIHRIQETQAPDLAVRCRVLGRVWDSWQVPAVESAEQGLWQAQTPDPRRRLMRVLVQSLASWMPAAPTRVSTQSSPQ